MAANDDSPLLKKLLAYGDIPRSDRELVNELVGEASSVGANEDLIREGDAGTGVVLVVDGFACRYKVTLDGGRQILAYLIPGDFCDLHGFVLDRMDHSISTLAPSRIVRLSRGALREMLERPALAHTLLISNLVDDGVLREWLVNLGQRSAEERIAHLLCELLIRFQAVGLSNGDSFDLPLTQTDLADTVGLSTVHVNRVLRRLREAGLVKFFQRKLTIVDLDGLIRFSDFRPKYLRLLWESKVRLQVVR